MATFKEQMAKDIKTGFLIGREFAELHVLDGIEMLIVVDEDLGEIKNKKQSDRFEGVSHAKTVIFISLEDYDEPVADQIVNFDGEFYKVVSFKCFGKMLEITLEANI